MSITIRTTQFKKEDESTLYQDYLVKTNIDKSLSVVQVKYCHKYDPNTENTSKTVTVADLPKYSNYNHFISGMLGEIKSLQDKYTYCEIECQCFKNGKRHAREYKIDLQDDKCFQLFAEIEMFLQSFFNPQKKIDDEFKFELTIGKKTLVDENLRQELNQMKEGVRENLLLMQDEVRSQIQDAMEDVMSSVSETKPYKPKKKGFLKRALGI